VNSYGDFGDDSFGGGGDGGEDWLTTYADAITLLMAFFVMLYSASKLDGKKFEDIKAGIETHVTHRRDASPTTGFVPAIPGVPVAAPSPDATDAELPKELIDGSGGGHNEGGGAQTPLERLEEEGKFQQSAGGKGMMLEFSSEALFEAGSARLKAGSRPALAQVGVYLRDRETAPRVLIEGHTDDSPIRSMRYQSNWDLSAARAIAVLRFLEDSGVDSQTMSATALAHTEPKLPNRDPWGNPVRANQEENRRVVLWVQER
jgi:chemotaxis protein MotB